MLSRTAEYALRAVVHLAQQPHGVPVRAGDLADAVDVPRNYLGKILHELVRAGVLVSSRGKSGGFSLALPAEKLPLLRIVAPFDNVTEKRQCILGRPECSEDDPCAAHSRWKTASEEISRFFRSTTVGNVLG